MVSIICFIVVMVAIIGGICASICGNQRVQLGDVVGRGRLNFSMI